MEESWIELKGVSQNNLKNISLRIPRNKLVVITGVSGSGKSSLAFDVIKAEGQRQYFVNLSASARRHLGKLSKPDIEGIQGLTPTLAISQTASQSNPRSTVGTLTEIYDLLRLLFARIGKSEQEDIHINRSLFSFNTKAGACPKCKGLGIEDKISVDLIVEDENRSLRNQALKITNPNGYTIYSQVTIEALNHVCNAHGFNVDIPWKDLTDDQKDIILNGSDIIKIPYGKHTLESRMKWTGITAKPREEGHYKGIIPVMEQILQRDRNTNILRFAKSQKCSSCNGNRLSDASLSVLIAGKNIAEYSNQSLKQLKQELQGFRLPSGQKHIFQPIQEQIISKIDILCQLGLGYLISNRQVNTLSGGELQRIRIARQLNSRLRNITFIFDEPSIGVHPSVNHQIIRSLQLLARNGNSVIVVEHDAQTIRSADWIVEIGPYAGNSGGEVMFNGSLKEYISSQVQTITKSFLDGQYKVHRQAIQKDDYGSFKLRNLCINNLDIKEVSFKYRKLNVVTGISGSGKSSLVKQSLFALIQNTYFQQLDACGEPDLERYNHQKVLLVNQSPIGKTNRSTPATYTKLHDCLRDFFASLENAKRSGLSKSDFSYNAVGGRCEKCEGTGKLEVGMHFLGNVSVVCDKCNGRRYKSNILKVKYNEATISDILDMSVSEAAIFFTGHKKIAPILEMLNNIGLGYLRLGQSSNTLSGGEAQRIKLASELVKAGSGNSLIILEEPSTGLHFYDLNVLITLFDQVLQKGNTLVVIEHNEDLIQNADHIIDLGPGSGEEGGRLVYEGDFDGFIKCSNSLTSKYLRQSLDAIKTDQSQTNDENAIVLKGVQTHNLKSIDISIPYYKHTVIFGKSGSGKSSLAFDTIYTEGRNRFTESFPAYLRQFTSTNSTAEFDSISGLTPVIALKQQNNIKDPRSTLGTLSEIYDHYRLLYSRYGTALCPDCFHETHGKDCPDCHFSGIDIKKASTFSFNNSEGCCDNCSGLGSILSSELGLLVDEGDKSFFEGTFKSHRSLDFYADPNGQYLHTLEKVGEDFGYDYHKPVKDLHCDEIQLALFGSGAKEYHVIWQYKRGETIGTHEFKGRWPGFANLLLDEYFKKHANGKGEDLLPFFKEVKCPVCNGQRFKEEVLSVLFEGLNIAELSDKSIDFSIDFFQNQPLKGLLIDNILEKLIAFKNYGLGYLNINRKSSTLSGGELQRVLLSSVLRSGISGVTYILDEPSIGLHPADVGILINNINSIVENGNTVITVEHNMEIILSADQLLQLGPGSGDLGGQLICSEATQNTPSTNTLKKPAYNTYLQIDKATANNLKGISVILLTGAYNVICGPSGSGKSSLLKECLYYTFLHRKPVNCEQISNHDSIDKIIMIDRKYADQSPLSTIASYMGLLGEIRKHFSKSSLANKLGLKTSDFSYSSKSGQCPDCKGYGYHKVSMDFLSDIQNMCETCKGQRYNRKVLSVKYLGLTISEILQMEVNDSREVFKDNMKIITIIDLLSTIGLGYLKMGQALNEISGGESQRLRIAREINAAKGEHNLFICDEPGKGLSTSDLKDLLATFELLLNQGHTLAVIEHSPYMISQAHHIIELGPEGGDKGGELIYQGDVGGLIKHANSKTGKYLREAIYNW